MSGSSWLTAAELEAIRADLERTLPDEAVIQSVTRTSDGQGSWSETWAAAGTVACRLDNAGGRRGRQSEAVQSFTSWTLTVPYDTDLTTEHRVVIGADTFSVTSVSDNHAWRAVRRAQLERI